MRVKVTKSEKKKLEDKLWKEFSIFIRNRDSNEEGFGSCFTCGRWIHWTKGDCGHGIPRQHKATKYNERNNHLQCKNCNGFQGGKREKYKKEMDKRYGAGQWDMMEMSSKQRCSWGEFEIKALYEHYKKLNTTFAACCQ